MGKGALLNGKPIAYKWTLIHFIFSDLNWTKYTWQAPWGARDGVGYITFLLHYVCLTRPKPTDTIL